ncbi:bis(5'-nucleosyl)-tetraphosphatase (symmetrical) YqeK [Synechococcus sp. O70.1]|jgi:predicted HD superfamily hydrolase involved in NAD metabolism|uniref:bis(5'-nucleosyl)-tetraphosphatase (symmetrical) YqeK n=1 Tax=unclassified Synechococcus TaxID=2626047 RepID=UPI0039C2E5B2
MTNLALRREEVLAWLQERVPPPRLRHILGVEAMARQLAAHYGLDEEKAAWAGLMHDLAKSFPAEQLLQRVARERELDEIERAEPHILHAEVGSLLAREQFQVQDAEILAAIANHTLGQPGMDPLSCVVFVADALEPNRGSSPELEQLRRLAFVDLSKAVVGVCDLSLRFLLNRNQVVHPRTLMTRNYFLLHPLDQKDFQRSASPVLSVVSGGS